MAGKWVSVLGFLGFMGLSVLLTSNERLKTGAVLFTEFMRANPVQGVLLHLVLSSAIVISGIPFSLIDLGAAWVFRDSPLLVLGMLLLSKTVGSAVCFFIARSVLSEERKQSILAHKTVARVNRVLQRSPIYFGTLARLATMPAVVKNYGLALLDINFGTYIICCMLGSVVGVPIQAFLGMKLGAFYLGLTGAEDNKEPTWMLAVGLLGIMSLVLVMRHVVAALLGSDEKEEPKKTE